ncbi:MAG TPA: DUF6199 family natural product biosynthesis protein [Natronosporangium sp.]
MAFLLVATGLWLLLRPRSVWRVLGAWQYRNPDANEPSEAAFRVYGSVSLTTGIVVAIMACGFASQPASEPSQPDEPSSEEQYQACLERERAADDGFGASPEMLCEVYRENPFDNP